MALLDGSLGMAGNVMGGVGAFPAGTGFVGGGGLGGCGRSARVWTLALNLLLLSCLFCEYVCVCMLLHSLFSPQALLTLQFKDYAVTKASLSLATPLAST